MKNLTAIRYRDLKIIYEGDGKNSQNDIPNAFHPARKRFSKGALYDTWP